jgi:hypothetical protein
VHALLAGVGIEKSWLGSSHRRLNCAEQANKLHPSIWHWMSKIAGATVVGQGICQRPYDQLTLSFIDHDLVFVVDQHSDLALQPTSSVVDKHRCTNPQMGVWIVDGRRGKS